MKIEDVILQIKEISDPRAIKIWARLGMSTENYFGAGLTKLKNLAKSIKKNHILSVELWNTRIHDARLLSCFICDPKKIEREDINKMADDIDFWDLGDNFVSYIVAKTPYKFEYIDLWLKSKNLYLRRAAFMMIAKSAKDEIENEDIYYLDILGYIKDKIKEEENWVKESMLYAIISIGQRNRELYNHAMMISEEIGKIDIDYGNSSCKAPDPLVTLNSEKTKIAIGII